MTKKEYCLKHEAIACHNYYRMQVHGIEYGINDYVYLSRIYQKTVCGRSYVMFHKLKIYYNSNGEPYIIVNESTFDGRRHRLYLSLDGFIKVDSPWGNPGVITCKELETFSY